MNMADAPDVEPGPPSQWSQLHADVLSAIFVHLASKDKGTARLVCRAWALQVLQDAAHVIRNTDFTPEAINFYTTKLPSLDSLSLMHVRSLFRVHNLTRITSLEVLQPSHLADFQPLTELPRLRKLRLDACEIGQAPCFRLLTQLKEVHYLSCHQSGGMHETDQIFIMFLKLGLEQLQFLHPLASRSLAPLPAPAWSVTSYEQLSCVTGLHALALTRASGLDVKALLPLVHLQALSLAGLMEFVYEPLPPPRPDEPSSSTDHHRPKAIAQLAQLRHLRVLDLRHSCHVDASSIMALPALRLLASHVPEHSLQSRGIWKLLRKVDMVADTEAHWWPVPLDKKLRLQSLVLHNIRRTGQNLSNDAVDEAHMRMFDSFWRAHVNHSVFEQPNLEDEYDEGDDWEDPFLDPGDAGYGYMEDAYGYMDELEDEVLDQFQQGLADDLQDDLPDELQEDPPDDLHGDPLDGVH